MAKKISIIYDSFPHYRAGIIKSLNNSSNFIYAFWGSKSSRDLSIKTFEFSDCFDFNDINLYQIGPFAFQINIIRKLIKSKSDCFIFLGNPYFISTWIAICVLRLYGRPVYLWSHGWLSYKENHLKRVFRNLFFSLANGIFLYGQRAKDIGISQGFKPNKLHVINNALDYSSQNEIFNSVSQSHNKTIKEELGVSGSKKIIVCSARLTKKCRFDILFKAISLLHLNTNMLIQVLLVGDGSERESLENLSKKLNLDVIYWGACYDEETLCKLYYVSDITVSPGKVGLTAIHSMTYGTPVISHNNLDNQMPEYETILPGITGDFFDENSSEDLARVLKSWFEKNIVKPEQNCIDRIAKFYTPDYQRYVIEKTIATDIGI